VVVTAVRTTEAGVRQHERPTIMIAERAADLILGRSVDPELAAAT